MTHTLWLESCRRKGGLPAHFLNLFYFQVFPGSFLLHQNKIRMGKAVLCQIDQTAGFAPAAGMFVRLLAQECFNKTQGQLLFTNTFRAVKKQCMRPGYPAAAAWLKIPYSVHVPEYRPT